MAGYDFLSATITLVYETGVDGKGESVFASQTYRNVANNVPAEQLSAVCAAVGGLSQHLLYDAVKTQKESILGN